VAHAEAAAVGSRRPPTPGAGGVPPCISRSKAYPRPTPVGSRHAQRRGGTVMAVLALGTGIGILGLIVIVIVVILILRVVRR
jgi:hypothetical protein